jgi:hypothetical protein
MKNPLIPNNEIFPINGESKAVILQQLNARQNFSSVNLEKIGALRNFLIDKSNNEMKDVKWTVRFLYCPRCGLRIPNSKILVCYHGYCPMCGCRMIEEGALPYISNNQKNNIKSAMMIIPKNIPDIKELLNKTWELEKKY